jgi:hypothetical protein
MCPRESPEFHRCFPEIREANQARDRKVPMKRYLLCALLLLSGQWHNSLVFGHSQSDLPEAPGSPLAAYDAPSFAAELHRLSDALGKNPSPEEMVALRDSLPKQWNVKTPDGSYSVSSEFLRHQLTAGPSGPAKAWVDHLALETERYSASRSGTPGNAKAELQKILAGAEFAGVRPPSAWDLFRQRLAVWLERLLLRIFGGLARYPIGGQILFWVAIVLGVGFIAFWLFRFLVGRDRLDSLPPSEVLTASRTWQEWIRAAREAASRNDFREAVHSAYWAGIVRLEETGVVPRDRTKTPREYLRMASETSPEGIAPSPAYREPLAALTTRLERIWYANRGAGADDFRDTLRQLEALGCQLE